MDLLRSRAIFKAKKDICWTNTTTGMLYVLNFCRNRLLITFARLPESIQKLKSRRSKSAIFRLQFCGMWFIMDISIFMPIWAYKHATSSPVYSKAWLPEEPFKVSGKSVSKWHLWANYEIVPKSRSNFEKIKFLFSVWKLHTPPGIKKVSNNFWEKIFLNFKYSIAHRGG